MLFSSANKFYYTMNEINKEHPRNLNVHQTLEELKKSNDRSERLLKEFGIDLCHLNDTNQHILDDYAAMKKATNLSNFDQSYVEEYCHLDQSKTLKNRTNLIKLKSEIRDLEQQIEKEHQQINIVTNCITNPKIITEDYVKKLDSAITNRIEKANQQLEQQTSDKNINLDDLIKKVKSAN